MTLNSDPAKIRAWQARSKPLGRSQGLTRTGFTLHVVRGEGAAVIAFPERKPARDTGPDAKTRKLVLARDRYACVCCGQSILGQRYSLGHRKRASQGGKAVPSNLLTFLGWGGEQHHGRIDNREDPRDEARGLTVRSHKDPALVPVTLVSGARVWLTDDGGYSDYPPDGDGAA